MVKDKKAIVVIGVGLGVITIGAFALAAKKKPPVPPPDSIGDLNDNGVIDLDDLDILQKYIAGYPISQISPLSDVEFLRRADVNGDGVVNAIDIPALEALIGEEEPPSPPATGMITLHMTGTPTQEWTVGWYYADRDRFIRNVEYYPLAGFETPWKHPSDPCTPPEPIDLNNLRIKIETYSEIHTCPLSGYKGSCRWGEYGPFVVMDGGVYTIDVTTGEVT